MDEVSLAIVSATFGGLAGSLLTLIVMRWSTLKIIGAAEKSLRTQLLYEEKKKALKELRRLIDNKYKTYDSFRTAIVSYLHSFESDFLPKDLRHSVQSKIYELDQFLEDSGLAPPSPSQEEIKSWEEDYELRIASLDWVGRAEHDFEQRFGTIKQTVRNLIAEYIKP